MENNKKKRFSFFDLSDDDFFSKSLSEKNEKENINLKGEVNNNLTNNINNSLNDTPSQEHNNVVNSISKNINMDDKIEQVNTSDESKNYNDASKNNYSVDYEDKEPIQDSKMNQNNVILKNENNSIRNVEKNNSTFDLYPKVEEFGKSVDNHNQVNNQQVDNYNHIQEEKINNNIKNNNEIEFKEIKSTSINNLFDVEEKLDVKTNIYIKKWIYKEVERIHLETGKSRSAVINKLLEYAIKGVK